MLTYLFIFIYLVVLSSMYYYLVDRREQIKILAIPTFILFLVVDGFRKFSVGSDLIIYVHIFRTRALKIPEFSNIFKSRFEIGYILFDNFLSSISEHYTILLFSFAAITLFIWFYIFWNYSENIFLSLVIYFSSLGMMFYSFSNIRQGLSIAIALLSFRFLDKRKYIRGIVCLALVPLFHTAGVICVLFLILKKIRLTSASYKYILIISIISFPFLKNLSEVYLKLFPQYSSYLETTWFLESYKFGPLGLTIVCTFLFVIGELILRKSKLTATEEYIKNLFFFYLIFTIFTLQTSLLERFGYYFAPFMALYVPMFISKIREKRIQWILFYTIIIIYGLLFSVIVYLKPEWYNVVPYRSVISDWLIGKKF